MAPVNRPLCILSGARERLEPLPYLEPSLGLGASHREQIDDVRIYNRALSSDEIATLHAGQ